MSLTNQPHDDILTLTKSFGFDFTIPHNIYFISPTEFAFISARTLTFAKLSSEGKVVQINKHVLCHDDAGIGAIAVDQENQRLLIAGKSKKSKPLITIHHLQTTALHGVLKYGTEHSYMSLDINSSDKNLLASLGSAPDFNLCIWDIDKRTILLKFKAFSQEIFSVKWGLFDSKTLTTAGPGHIKFWKITNSFTGVKLQGQLGKFGQVELSPIDAVCDLPSGLVCSTHEEGSLMLWDGERIKSVIVLDEAHTPCHQGGVTWISIIPAFGELQSKGQKVLLSCGQNELHFWDIAALEKAEPQEDSDDLFAILTPLRTISFQKSLKELRLSVDCFQFVPYNREEIVATQSAVPGNNTQGEGGYLFLIDKVNGLICRMDLRTEECIISMKRHAGHVLDIFPISRPLLSFANFDSKATLRGLKDSQRQNIVTAISTDGQVNVWDMGNTTAILPNSILDYRMNKGSITSCCVINNARSTGSISQETAAEGADQKFDSYFLGFSDGSVSEVLFKDGLFQCFEEKIHSAPVKFLASSPDGQWQASASADGRLFLYRQGDEGVGEKSARVVVGYSTLPGIYSEDIMMLQGEPTERILSGEIDLTQVTWKYGDMKGLQFSPDSSRLLTFSSTGYIWEMLLPDYSAIQERREQKRQRTKSSKPSFPVDAPNSNGFNLETLLKEELKAEDVSLVESLFLPDLEWRGLRIGFPVDESVAERLYEESSKDNILVSGNQNRKLNSKVASLSKVELEEMKKQGIKQLKEEIAANSSVTLVKYDAEDDGELLLAGKGWFSCGIWKLQSPIQLSSELVTSSLILKESLQDIVKSPVVPNKISYLPYSMDRVLTSLVQFSCKTYITGLDGNATVRYTCIGLENGTVLVCCSLYPNLWIAFYGLSCSVTCINPLVNGGVKYLNFASLDGALVSTNFNDAAFIRYLQKMSSLTHPLVETILTLSNEAPGDENEKEKEKSSKGRDDQIEQKEEKTEEEDWEKNVNVYKDHVTENGDYVAICHTKVSDSTVDNSELDLENVRQRLGTSTKFQNTVSDIEASKQTPLATIESKLRQKEMEEKNRKSDIEKQQVLDEVNKLQERFQTLLKKNNESLSFPLSVCDLVVDKEYMDTVLDTNRAEVLDVNSATKEKRDRFISILDNMIRVHMSDIDCEHFSITSLRQKGSKVSSITTRKISDQVQSELAKLKSLLKDMDSDYDDDNEHENGNDRDTMGTETHHQSRKNQGFFSDTAPGKTPTVKSFRQLDGNSNNVDMVKDLQSHSEFNNEDIGDHTSSQALDPLEALRRIRQERLEMKKEREKHFQDLLKLKPKDDYVGPEEMEQLQKVKENDATIVLKGTEETTVEDYEEDTDTAEGKKRIYSLIYEAIHSIKTEFNLRICALRSFKQRLLTALELDSHVLKRLNRSIVTMHEQNPDIYAKCHELYQKSFDEEFLLGPLHPSFLLKENELDRILQEGKNVDWREEWPERKVLFDEEAFQSFLTDNTKDIPFLKQELEQARREFLTSISEYEKHLKEGTVSKERDSSSLHTLMTEYVTLASAEALPTVGPLMQAQLRRLSQFESGNLLVNDFPFTPNAIPLAHNTNNTINILHDRQSVHTFTQPLSPHSYAHQNNPHAFSEHTLAPATPCSVTLGRIAQRGLPGVISSNAKETKKAVLNRRRDIIHQNFGKLFDEEIAINKMMELVLMKKKIEANIEKCIVLLDSTIFNLENERIHLLSDIVRCELKICLLKEEGKRLSILEEESAAVRVKLQNNRAEKAAVLDKIQANERSLQNKCTQIDQIEKAYMDIVSQLDGILNENQLFAIQLRKMFEKRQPKKMEKSTNGSKGNDTARDYWTEDDDDINEEELLEYMEGSDSGYDEDKIDICPNNCSTVVWNTVMELREKKYELDNMLRDLKVSLNEDEKQGGLLLQDEKKLAGEQEKIKQELKKFFIKKKKELNLVYDTMPLRASQVVLKTEMEAPDATLVLPSTLDNHVVITSHDIERFVHREQEYQEEKRRYKEVISDLKKELYMEVKGKNLLQQENKDKRDELAALMKLRFGRVINLDMVMEKMNQDTAVTHDSLDVIKQEEARLTTLLGKEERELAQLKEELKTQVDGNTELLNSITVLGNIQLSLDRLLQERLKKAVVFDNLPIIKIKTEEKNKLRDLIVLQAKEIETLKSEIHLFKRKGGHIYSTVTANRLQQLN